MSILDTIKNFFVADAAIPHHFFTVETTHLDISDIRTAVSGKNISYIFDKHYDAFGVDDARTLVQLQNEKTENISVYIISFVTITVEAQNALLKALEEPKRNKIFFFVISNSKKLLPALQSRTYLLLDTAEKSASVGKIDIADFIATSLQEQLELIKKITDKKLKNDEKFSKSDLLTTLNNFEIYFYKNRDVTMLRKILAARTLMNAKGASVKMILDDVVMTMSLLK